MMTQTKITTNPSQTTSTLTRLADFIHQRKAQKQVIEQNANKNSLSELNKNSKKDPKKKEKILEIFNLLNEQLAEGHTVYEVVENEANFGQVKELVDLLVAEHWASLLDNQAEQKISSDTNTAMIIKHLTSPEDSQTVPHDSYIFWLHRHWYAEHALAKQLMKIATRKVEAFDFDTDQPINAQGMMPNEKQQLAIKKANQHALSIIIGGPGTGKTFTVAKLVSALQKGYEQKRLQDANLPPLSITLTAPTGKAAQRMQESLLKSLEDDNISLDDAKTLHRLLGIGSDGIPRYHAKNPLPDDLVIVDEASMLGLELASQLVDAIKPTGRLILLGDANQLAAVDAGSVLSDLCQVNALQPYITELSESKRFDKDSIVGQFALAIQQPLPAAKKINLVTKQVQVIDVVSEDSNAVAPDNNKIPFYPIDNNHLNLLYQQLAKPYQPFFKLIQDLYNKPVDIFEADNRKALFEIFDRYRILCAGHQGQLGTKAINQKMSQAFTDFAKITRNKSYFYHGLPLIIQSNDYQLGLFNGDIAICLLYQRQLYACFANKVIPIQRLSRDSCDYAYAMTIHKSQGSEFDNVAICLDKAHTRLLSQALIYTAVTRSKSALSIYSTKQSFDIAITQQSVRQTGLQLQFEALVKA